MGVDSASVGALIVRRRRRLDDLVENVTRGVYLANAVQMVIDSYDQLRSDSAAGGRVMAIALHPFVIGQPFRHRYLEEALAYIAAQPDAWLTTSDDILSAYRRQLK